VIPTSTEAILMRQGIAPLIAASPVFQAAVGAATVNEALPHVMIGGDNISNFPAYPYCVIGLADNSQAKNPPDAALNHFQRSADIDVAFWYVNPDSLGESDNRYEDAVNFLCGVLDDLCYLLAHDVNQGRPLRLPLVDSIDKTFGPELSDESEQDDDGNITREVWSGALKISVHSLMPPAGKGA
jgi:hypothetical protein